MADEATEEDYQRVFLQSDAGRKVFAEILTELDFMSLECENVAANNLARFLLFRCGILKAEALPEMLKKWYEVAVADRIGNVS